MMRRFVPVLVAVGVAAGLLGGCAAEPTEGLGSKERTAALRATIETSRVMHQTTTQSGSTAAVDVVVEDDYRYAAKHSLNGAVLYEEVVYDDARAVRAGTPAVLGPNGSKPEAAPLVAGEWVQDGDKAPPEFMSPLAPVRLLDPRPTLEVVRSTDDWLNSRSGTLVVASLKKWDPKSQFYVKQDDKFEPHLEGGLRYDFVPAHYDADAFFSEGIPSDFSGKLHEAFTYISFWFKDGRLTRVEGRFLPNDKKVARDLRAEAKRQAKRAGVPVSQIKLPAIPPASHQVTTFEFGHDMAKVAMPPTKASISLAALSGVSTGPGAKPPTTPAAPAPPTAPAQSPPTIPGVPVQPGELKPL
jgi:hypothetical protein